MCVVAFLPESDHTTSEGGGGVRPGQAGSGGHGDSP